ncbi:hypothetical protein BS50DRAFT_557225 [Corynespora cassiicola Philippines]|uniref:F-box domain-containing protein n=1 Tax=Corynespora cassiicola Philippines TaxID=1448308 RepID=A0A2T2NGP2_CORCC|nr:hypothetical protein BS50DRAFT_557225 [Corynespora cassiicola Philippines]
MAGRPKRRNAGKSKKQIGFVDSSLIEDDDHLDSFSESNDDDDVVRSRSKAKSKKSKRKRPVSPEPPPLDPTIYDDEDPDGLSEGEDGVGMYHRAKQQPSVILQFNIPMGFCGPLQVKLDSELLNNLATAATQDAAAQNVETPPHEIRRVDEDGLASDDGAFDPNALSFTDLPGEVRNNIYRRLLLAPSNIIAFGDRAEQSCSRSGQFLRTCKTVHSEACSILYGENTFQFHRDRRTRAPMWDETLKEVGYKDVRYFLKTMGPANLQYLRDIKFEFDDATQSLTPYLKTIEARRYINDEYLIDCLRMLRHAKLRTLTLVFFGRRSLYRTDVNFLSYLEQIKADKVIKAETRWYSNKVSYYLWADLEEAMTRKKKLYAKK